MLEGQIEVLLLHFLVTLDQMINPLEKKKIKFYHLRMIVKND